MGRDKMREGEDDGTPLVLTDDIEVFGLHDEVRWPKGTRLRFMDEAEDGSYRVIEVETGRVLNLPRRLLRRVPGVNASRN